MRARTLNLITVFALLGLLAAVSLSAPLWARLLQREAGGRDEESAAELLPSPPPTKAAQRTISVKLYFEAEGRRGLVAEERTVPFSNDLAAQLRAVVEELAAGSRTGLVPTLPPETRVLDVFVTGRGIAYVDLSPEVAQSPPPGAEAELLTIFSVVNSLAANFPAVRRVHILVGDQPVTTLAGHVDLSRPLAPDMTLMAEALNPPPPPSPAPPSPAPVS